MPSVPPVVPPREWRPVVLLAVLIVLLLALPYALAYRAPGDFVFTGSLVNRADGQSYLAKMQLGWRGDWLFTLPYTAAPGAGVMVYEPFLLLGHLARWTGAGVAATFHAARMLAGLFFLLRAYHFIARFFAGARERLGLWLLFGLGAGLGWLAVPFGLFPSDLWVAEAVPFLSVFMSVHFPLTAGLMLWVFELTVPGLAPAWSLRQLALIAFTVTLITQTQPLALIVVLACLGVATLYRAAAARRFAWGDWLPLTVAAACSLPWLAYDAWLAVADPQIAAWTAQNLTPSPAVWDAVLSGGVPLLLTLPGLAAAVRRRTPLDMALLAWLGVTVIGMYTPWSLQRRLSLGIWMPVVLLAGIGLRDVIWPRLSARWRPLLLAGIALGALPSSLLVYAAAASAVARRDPQIFLTRAEADGLDWLQTHGQAGDVVLAAPDTGLFVPARTGLRVIYGHPLETIDAAHERAQVEAFFRSQLDPAAFVAAHGVAYIFYGPREQLLGPLPPVPGWKSVFQQGSVTIYGR